MKIKCEAITKKEFDYAYEQSVKTGVKPYMESVHESFKLGKCADIVCFHNECEQSNSDTCKVFFISRDEKSKTGSLHFIGEMAWSSHIMDFDFDLSMSLIVTMVHQWLLDIALRNLAGDFALCASYVDEVKVDAIYEMRDENLDI